MKTLTITDEPSHNQSTMLDVLIWCLLVALTLLSYWLGYGADKFTVATINTSILLITFIKIRWLILHFMELKNAHFGLRIFFEFWCIGVCLMLIFLLVL
jgi:hypothetical protein